MRIETPLNLTIACLLAVPGCVTEQDLGEPPATDGDAGGGASDAGSTGSSGDPTSGQGTTGDDTETSSGSDGADASSSGAPQQCLLGDEGIEISRLDVLAFDSFEDVPCEVTPDDGFACTVEDGLALFDVDAVLEGLTALPWEVGQSVLLSWNGPLSSAYQAQMTVRSEDQSVLAIAVWNQSFVPEPFSLELEDIGCVDPDSSVIPLQATYGFGGESVALLGSASAQLGDYALFQEDAADYSQVSAGELGESATFAFVRLP